MWNRLEIFRYRDLVRGRRIRFFLAYKRTCSSGIDSVRSILRRSSAASLSTPFAGPLGPASGILVPLGATSFANYILSMSSP